MTIPKNLLPPGRILRSAADRSAYSYDGALERAMPDAVAIPESAEEISRVVLFCAAKEIPLTARGAGTNLSGGSIPLRGGLALSLSRLDRIGEISLDAGFAVAEAGAVNGRLQEKLRKSGFFYAPDPASLRVSTLGGNISENAGGPRCLKYGVTSNHVLGLAAVMSDGSTAEFTLEDAGPEIMSLLVGSEGTLAVVTEARLRVVPEPPEVTTLLAAYPSIESAMECVSGIVGRGLLPRVLEAMDRRTIQAIEAHCRAGYPDAEAVLLIELDGRGAPLGEQAAFLERFCRSQGASLIEATSDPAKREKLWEGRRAAYAAMARIAPNVLVEDGVVPRDKLAQAARLARAQAENFGVSPALLFHAGDGNLHPNIPFDERNREEVGRVKAAGSAILRVCAELGGTISGEHGIGSDKRAAMRWIFGEPELSLFRRIKSAFDPMGILNPGKIIPEPGEGPRALARPRRPLSPQAAGLRDALKTWASRGRKVAVLGSGSRGLRIPPGAAPLGLMALGDIIEIDSANQTVTAEAGCLVFKLQEEIRSRGLRLWAPLADDAKGTLGGLLASKACPSLRDELLGMRILLSDGEVLEFGGKFMKNVAGYDIPRLLLGSWGALAVILDATLKIHPAALEPALPLLPSPPPKPFRAGPWTRRLKEAFDPKGLLNPWLMERKT